MDLLRVAHKKHLTYQSFTAQVEIIAVQQVLTLVTQCFIRLTETNGFVVGDSVRLREVDAASHVVGGDAIPAVLLDILILDDYDPVARVVIVREADNLLGAIVETGVFNNKHVRNGCSDVVAETLGNLIRGAVGAKACTSFQEPNVLMSFDSIFSDIHKFSSKQCVFSSFCKIGL